MVYDIQQRQRRSIRLKDYDYSQEGAYFVTICTHGHKCLFGGIVNGKMCLNRFGSIVNECLMEIPAHFTHVEIDMFVVMPNHVHGIIVLINNCRGEVTSPIPKGAATAPLQKCTLGQVIAYFKYQTTKAINKIRLTPGNRIWQRNYYEHVIRNEADLNEIRQYILDNPVQWDKDENNPTRQLPEPPYDNMVGAQNFVPLRQGDKVCLIK